VDVWVLHGGGQLHTLKALPKGEEPLLPIEYGAGWAPELVWKFWTRKESEKNLEPNQGCPARGPPLYCLSNASFPWMGDKVCLFHKYGG
jgi:hypothetical protein